MPKSPSVPMKWDAPQERALALAFEGRWTQDEIVEKLNKAFGSSTRFHLSARALRGWIAHPDFQSRLDAMRNDLAASLRDVAYAHKTQRIIGLAQMAESARREYETRPWLQEVRPTPNGDITNESFNRDAHAAFRGALDDIAKELGERSSNVNVTAQATSLGVTVVLEQMRDDPRLAGAANDFLGLVAGVAEAR